MICRVFTFEEEVAVLFTSYCAIYIYFSLQTHKLLKLLFLCYEFLFPAV